LIGRSPGRVWPLQIFDAASDRSGGVTFWGV
jgi:hypothetical protein